MRFTLTFENIDQDGMEDFELAMRLRSLANVVDGAAFDVDNATEAKADPIIFDGKTVGLLVVEL